MTHAEVFKAEVTPPLAATVLVNHFKNIFMTIAEFKRKLTSAKESGSPVKVQLFKPNGEHWYLSMDFGPRKVSAIQSNSYALKSIREGKPVDSWAEWPKSGEVELLHDGKIQVTKVDKGIPWSRLVYEF